MMEEAQERAAAQKEASAMNAGMPRRFFCGVGESRDLIIVDDRPDWFRWEHNLKNNRTGRYDIFCACINENAHCPVCKASERPSYLGMFLTIIDLTPYTTQSGEEVTWSKKLLVVKPQQQKKIMRLSEKYGTTRGLMLRMTRDGEKDAAIGNDIDDLGFVEEADLEQYVNTYIDKKDVEHEVIGYEAFDYDDLFPRPSEEQLRAIVGGQPEPGSRDHDRAALRGGRNRGGDDWAGDARPAVRRRAAEDDDPPARTARPPVARRGAPVDDVEDAPTRPVARRAPVRAAPVDDPVDEGVVDDEPEQPAARRPLARPAARPAAAPVRRAAPAARDDDAELPEEDDAPQRRPAARPPVRQPVREAAAPAESLADRRRALRR
jgi:hypothetical protein